MLGDRRGLVETLTNLGVLLRCVGSGARARSSFEEALAVSRALGDQAWEGRILNKLARLTFYEGDLLTARALHEEGIVNVRLAGNSWDVAIALGDLADVCHELGDDATAQRLYAESLKLWLGLGDERGVAQALEGFAILGFAESSAEQTVRLIATAQTIRERITEPSSPHRRATLEKLLDNARATLGATYDAVWTAGCAAAPADVAAEILADDPEIAAASPAPTSPAPTPPAIGRDSASDISIGLSAREREVLSLIARGLTNASIAEALVVSRRTVEWHVSNILGKLGLQSRSQLVVWARRHGISPTE